MFVTPTGLIIISIYCMISGFAGVVNEWIMKKGTGSDTVRTHDSARCAPPARPC
jgi:hypothetical protein